VVAVLVHNLTDDRFVHAMELTFAMTLGLLLVLGARGPARARHTAVRGSRGPATT
jgi:hypothetical protein